MAPGVFRLGLISLIVAGIGAAALAVLALALAAAAGQAGAGMLIGIGAAAGAAGLGRWWRPLGLRYYARRLARRRCFLLFPAAHDAALAARWLAPATDEAGRLAQTASQVISQQRARRADPDGRLAAVVAATAEGLVVITQTGLVSLVNAAALARLGADRVLLGTSVYDLFHRSDLGTAVEQARAAGRPVTTTLTSLDGERIELRIADLGEAGGAVLSLAPGAAAHGAGLHQDFGLHEQPPAAGAIDAGTTLESLPVVVLDTETTGLDVASDRIVSVGAVRLHGSRVFRHLTLDRLVNPGQPIPARSTAVHGISTAMVAGAPAFGAVLPDIVGFLSGTVVVGHCIGFDMTMLAREAARAGAAWSPPRTLDTMLLAGALYSETEELSLDALAERLGVTVQGRHTALGDALVTAAVYARLVPLLQDAGIVSFGDAVAFAARPRKLIAQQRAAGW